MKNSTLLQYGTKVQKYKAKLIMSHQIFRIVIKNWAGLKCVDVGIQVYETSKVS